MTGRNPYDTSRYNEDVADRSLSEIFWALKDADEMDEVTFIALSGRSAEFAEVTMFKYKFASFFLHETEELDANEETGEAGIEA